MGLLVKFMVGVNVLLNIFGLVLIGGASYVLYEFADFEDLVPRGTVITILMAGLFIFVLTFLGCYGVWANKHLFICLYIVLLTCAVAVQFVGAYYFLVFFGNASSAESRTGSALEAEASDYFQNYMLSTYTDCCTGCIENLNCDRGNFIEPSKDENGTFFCNQTDPINPQCEWALECDDNQANSSCYITPDGLPPFDILSAVCLFLEVADTGNQTETVVGPPENGWSCGAGKPGTYVENFITWINARYYWISAITWTAIVVQMLCLLGAIYVYFCYGENH